VEVIPSLSAAPSDVQASRSPADTIAAALPPIAEALVALALAGNTTAITLCFKLSGDFDAVDWQLLDDTILAASAPQNAAMRADLASILDATLRRILRADAAAIPPPIVATKRRRPP
jgi:hypothetical protein